MLFNTKTVQVQSGLSSYRPIGFQGKEAEQDLAVLAEANVKQIITARLSPELVNRLQAVVVFRSLDEKTLDAILDLYVQSLNRQLSERQISVELEKSAKAFLLEQGYSAEFGARHLKRAFERLIAEPLSREILSGKLKAGQQVIFLMENGQLRWSTRSTTGIHTELYRPS